MTEEEFQKTYASSLNDAQWQAVCAAEGPVLLLAVPGSGKTTVLVTRLGYLVRCRGIDPANILTMTYTVAATREMSARFCRMFGEEYGKDLEFRTINGLSQKIIDYCSTVTGRAPFRLQDNEGELSRLVREIYRSVNEDFPTDSVIRDIRTSITYIKNRMLTPEEIEKLDTGISHLPEIFQLYCKTLRDARLMDYDDQMQYALNILKASPAILTHFQEQYPYICVDEAQDTSRIQHEIIRLLASRYNHIFMVGDEDQSIYGFRAAYPDALVQFESTYPNARVLVMEQNYRSTNQIIASANDFVARNRFRHPKQIRGTQGSGTPVQIVELKTREDQYAYLLALAKQCDGETAVLYRNNDSAVPLIDLLERNGIPYNARKFDEVFFAHRVIADITDIILFAQDPADTERFLRIYYKFGCGISKMSAQYACRRSQDSGRPVLQELLRYRDLKPGIRKRVQELQDNLTQLREDKAADAVDRIRREMGYGDYLEKNSMDDGKLTILEALGRELPSAAALLHRLEELRVLIGEHRNRPENRFLLSTIHSSKGLEYRRVYLLDVFSGTLPALTAGDAVTEEKIREYEEERRLFYVAMTRAQEELNLFHCQSEESEFVSEIMAALPKEKFSDGELLTFLRRSLIGKTYRHREYGVGRVRAQREDRLLIAYPGGITELTDLAALIRDRQRSYAEPEKGKTGREPKPTRRLQEIADDMKVGSLVEHNKFGPGTVTKLDAEKVSVRFRDNDIVRTFLKSAVIPTGKLSLVKDE